MKQEARKIIADYVDSHRDEMLSLWEELVNMESGSQNKAGIDAVAERLQQVLAAEGAAAKIVGIARIKDRHFHPVVARGLEFFEQGIVLFRHVSGPEQEVKADFHGRD